MLAHATKQPVHFRVLLKVLEHAKGGYDEIKALSQAIVSDVAYLDLDPGWRNVGLFQLSLAYGDHRL